MPQLGSAISGAWIGRRENVRRPERRRRLCINFVINLSLKSQKSVVNNQSLTSQASHWHHLPFEIETGVALVLASPLDWTSPWCWRRPSEQIIT